MAWGGYEGHLSAKIILSQIFPIFMYGPVYLSSAYMCVSAHDSGTCMYTISIHKNDVHAMYCWYLLVQNIKHCI